MPTIANIKQNMNWIYDLNRLQWNACSSCDIANVNSQISLMYQPSHQPHLYEFLAMECALSEAQVDAWNAATTTTQKSIIFSDWSCFFLRCLSAKTRLHKHEVWFIGKLENDNKNIRKRRCKG